jgi:hypothetical protein
MLNQLPPCRTIFSFVRRLMKIYQVLCLFGIDLLWAVNKQNLGGSIHALLQGTMTTFVAGTEEN